MAKSKPNYLEQSFSVIGYSAQELERGTDPTKIIKHLRSELDRLRVISDVGKVHVSYELPKILFSEWRYEKIGQD